MCVHICICIYIGGSTPSPSCSTSTCWTSAGRASCAPRTSSSLTYTHPLAHLHRPAYLHLAYLHLPASVLTYLLRYAEDLELIAARECQSEELLQQRKLLAGIASRAGVEGKRAKQSQHIVAAQKCVRVSKQAVGVEA